MSETQEKKAPTTEPDFLLDEKEQAELDYLNRRIGTPAFAVARRQGFGRVLAIVDKLVATVKKQALQLKHQNYLVSGLHLAATGKLTEEQINASPVLSALQKVDMVKVARLYQDAEAFRQQAIAQKEA